jgi:hypothetical protein
MHVLLDAMVGQARHSHVPHAEVRGSEASVSGKAHIAVVSAGRPRIHRNLRLNRDGLPGQARQ